MKRWMIGICLTLSTLWAGGEWSFQKGNEAYADGDYVQALHFYTKSCQQDNARGCYCVGGMYDDGEGTRQNKATANQLYAKAAPMLVKECTQHNNALSCFFVGFMIEEGRVTQRNRSLAKEYYGRACDLKMQDGCDRYREL